tara:strand:+ start:7384 stop:7941 length:558 start_codon:yes stop_codon:yes gene_type:complete
MKFTSTFSFYRSWIVNNKEMADIIFYQDGEIIANTGTSYLEAVGQHGMKTDITEVPEITEVKRANKLNLDRKDCFTFKDKIYIYAPLLNATPMKEVLHSQFESGQQNYINAFNLTFTHEGEKQTLTFHAHTYTRVVHTGISAISQELKSHLEALGFDKISDYEANKMVQNADTILAILEKAKATK